MRRTSRSWRSWCGLMAVSVGLFVVAGCGDTTGSDTTAHDEESNSEEEGHSEEFHFGEPAEAADADRTIDIEVGNDLAFDPGELTVSAGETITFRIANTGDLAHDFTLGDEETQDAHEAEMMASGDEGDEMEHSDPNAVSVHAGETVELTWHFTEPGTVLYGCHVEGHYAAGMKGTITVES